MSEAENMIRWPCGVCGRMTATRHHQRGGVFVHDPLAAAGLTTPEPSPPPADEVPASAAFMVCPNCSAAYLIFPGGSVRTCDECGWSSEDDG